MDIRYSDILGKKHMESLRKQGFLPPFREDSNTNLLLSYCHYLLLAGSVYMFLRYSVFLMPSFYYPAFLILSFRYSVFLAVSF